MKKWTNKFYLKFGRIKKMQKVKKTEKQTTTVTQPNQNKPKIQNPIKPKTNFNSFEATKFLNERLN
jgi:hypothetical protein